MLVLLASMASTLLCQSVPNLVVRVSMAPRTSSGDLARNAPPDTLFTFELQVTNTGDSINNVTARVAIPFSNVVLNPTPLSISSGTSFSTPSGSSGSANWTLPRAIAKNAIFKLRLQAQVASCNTALISARSVMTANQTTTTGPVVRVMRFVQAVGRANTAAVRPLGSVDLAVLNNDLGKSSIHNSLDIVNVTQDPGVTGSVQVITSSVKNSFITQQNPGIRYTNTAGQAGQRVVIQYRFVNDSTNCNSNITTVTITLGRRPPTLSEFRQPPGCLPSDELVANDDLGNEVCQNGTLCIPVLSNDSFPPGSTLTLIPDSTFTTYGDVVAINNSIPGETPVYFYIQSQPIPPFNDPAIDSVNDSFSYEFATTNNQCSNLALVGIIIYANPVAPDINTTACASTPTTINVYNDAIHLGDPGFNQINIVSPPIFGDLTINNDSGDIIYTNDTGLPGFMDSFDYTISTTVNADTNNDLVCTSSVATVTITIVPNPTIPPSIIRTVCRGQFIAIMAFAGSTNRGSTTTIVITQTPAHGSLAINLNNGNIRYTNNISDPAGTDTFKFMIINNDTGCPSNEQTVNIIISGTNNDSFNTCKDQDQFINLTANDTALFLGYQVTLVAPFAAHGTVQPSPATMLGAFPPNSGTAIYTPTDGFVGIDTFDYRVVDQLCTTTARVTMQINGAVDDTALVCPDNQVVIDVLANDFFTGSPTVTIVFPGPSQGTAVVQPDQTVLYTANIDASGFDEFDYILTDSACTSSAHVTITIIPPRPVPPIDDTTCTSNTIIIDVLQGASPATNEVIITTQPAQGSASVNAFMQIVYDPAGAAPGTYAIGYRVCSTGAIVSQGFGPLAEGDPCCSQGVIQVTVGNPPAAVNDSASTTVSAPVNINVLANDTFTPPVALSVISQPAQGTAVVVPADGTFGANPYIRYTPNGTPGIFIFQYRIVDASGCDATASVTVTVTGSVIPPVLCDQPIQTVLQAAFPLVLC